MPTLALVLSYDRNRICTENMILQYERLLGPDAFHFVIPYQDDVRLCPRIRSETTMVRCDSAIPASVAALLDAVDADEMVYWCIDDKYPIELDRAALGAVAQIAQKTAGLDGLCLGVARRIARGEGLERRSEQIAGLDGLRWHRRTNFNQFWLHQFVRAKVIAHVFDHFPARLGAAKEMDTHIDAITQTPFNMYVADTNRIVFGESASGGALTRNFVETARSNGLTADPTRSVTDGSIRIGTMGDRVKFSRKNRWWWR